MCYVEDFKRAKTPLRAKRCRLWIGTSVRPQTVGFGSEQGLSDFETGGIAGYVEDFKRAKTPLRAKRCRLWTDTTLQG